MIILHFHNGSARGELWLAPSKIVGAQEVDKGKTDVWTEESESTASVIETPTQIARLKAAWEALGSDEFSETAVIAIELQRDRIIARCAEIDISEVD